MQPPRLHSSTRRPGLTLIEMLVVIGILLLLFALAVAFVPRVNERDKIARGADRLQGFLLIAKQRALRDRVPTGVRLITDSSGQVRELHYIQQPDDFAAGQFLGATGMTAMFAGVDFTGGPGVPADLAPVQVGDYLEVHGGGLVHFILAVSATQLTLASPVSGAPTANYRVIRQPRRLSGEQPLQMPSDVAIDMTTDSMGNLAFSQNVPVRSIGTTAGVREILFSPSGAVVGQGTGSDRIILWVRDTSRDSATEGGPTLICIYIRTGFIAAHPVDLNGSDPYSFTRDGRSSGL